MYATPVSIMIFILRMLLDRSENKWIDIPYAANSRDKLYSVLMAYKLLQ